MEILPEASTALKRDIVHAFKSIPKRGAESGGLLCGDLKTGRVAGVVPVPIEYKFGPTYRLSERDKKQFHKAIAEHSHVIGWYRSDTRNGGAPTEEDRQLTRTFFADKTCAFLIGVPDAEQSVRARVFERSGGREKQVGEIALGRFSLLQEALEAADREDEGAGASAHEQAEAAAAIAAAAAEKPKPVVVEFPAPPAPQLHIEHPSWQLSPMWRVAWIAVMSLALLAAGGFVLQYGWGAPAVHATSVTLGMKVDRQGEALVIGWDRNSPLLADADGATCVIDQGSRHKEFDLSGTEMRSGGIVYTPNGSDDVRVQLALHARSGDLAQSLRIIVD